jgi:serine/threonine protein phosphatase PrpC
MNWQFASALTIGDREEQQDRVAIFHPEVGDGHLLVLADGMGGHKDGAMAAQTVIDIASCLINDTAIDDPDLFLKKICLDAHSAISALAEAYASPPGSTCVVLYLKGNEAYCAHVGDSRLYQFRNGNLIYVTSDHSLAQLMEEHADGADYAATQNQLYMCLGGNNDMTPELFVTGAEVGDLFLLCSDGFWGQVDVEKIFTGNCTNAIDEECAEQFVQLASKLGHGQSDNVSLAMAYCQGDTRIREQLGLPKRFINWFRKTVA